MPLPFLRLASVLMILGCVAAGAPAPAHGCLQISPFEAGKPFSSAYFDAGGTVFQGIAVGYSIGEVGAWAEITFNVSKIFRGEDQEHWTVIWFDSPIGLPNDLDSFKREIGEDLLVVLEPVVVPVGAQRPTPMVMQWPCQEPAMQTFAVMEPALREQGLIE